MQGADDPPETPDLPAPSDPSLPTTWRDGSRVAFPTQEEIAALQKDKPSPGRTRRIAWVVFALLLLVVLFALLRPEDNSHDSWPGIRMKPVSGAGRAYDAVPDL